MSPTANADQKTIEGFGDEWERFDQSQLSPAETQEIFESYFAVFPWQDLPRDAVGFDAGCGSGRWAKVVAPRVGKLHLVDPSAALEVAQRNLAPFANCEFHRATVDEMPLKDGAMDFGYSLGVLHHIPDTGKAMACCVKKLKPGAPFLVYLYYAFDHKPWWFRGLWKLSDLLRQGVCRLPHWLRYWVSQLLAVAVYLPLSRGALLLEHCGVDVANFPLSAYRKRSFYVLRTDALDRFGTRLEQRFTRQEIAAMMERAGLDNITFSDAVPFWCAVGYRKA